MQAARNPLQATNTAIALLMAVALMFAQWIGLQHRIAHAYLQQERVSVSSIMSDDSDRDKAAYHSCAAFDAAAVCDAIDIIPFISPLVTSAQVLALWAAFISWDAPVISWFSSRAPPLA